MAVSKAALERQKLEVQIRKLTAEAEGEETHAERTRFYWDTEVDRARVYRFNDEVNVHTTTHCIQNLRRMLAADPTAPIEIVFNSPGGSVFAGLELYDHLMALRAN